MNYSQYQQSIFDWIQNGSVHAVVIARAGSGKTFTIEHALKFVEPGASVLFLAFNKHIAEELKGRINMPTVEVATLNSFGWRICRSNVRGVKMSFDKTRYAIKEVIEDWKERRVVQGAISRLIGLKKATYGSGQTVEELALKFDVDLPDSFDEGAFEEVWDLVVEDIQRMDFDDQIFMPVYNGWAVPIYDWVFVDEAQDLSPTQIQLVSKAGMRIVAVGDDKQAIYGFRGADPDAINNIISELEPTVLPLNVCYRCPSAVLDEARKIVPDIEDAPGCIEGSVRTTKKLDATEGDYVLCRTTAPLVSACLKMLADGRKAVVKGRDIGMNLVNLMKKVGLDQPLVDFIEGLQTYYEQEADKLRRQEREAALQTLEDKVTCIQILTEGCADVQAVVDRIERIFTNNDRGVVFCTVHRAKGLQAPRIWIIHPELLPFPKAKLPWQ